MANTIKSVEKKEVVPGDRATLLQSAVRIIESFNYRMATSSYAAELNGIEETMLDRSCRFLIKQFEVGPLDFSTVEVERETETKEEK